MAVETQIMIKMRAIVISQFGGPEVLQLRDVSQPTPDEHELLVKVHATALNRADLLQRRGKYPAPVGVAADIPGLEFAGEVVGKGTSVSGWQLGDKVMGLLSGGGYAEYVVVDERLCMPVPPALSLADAAAIPEAFLTAYDALFSLGQLTRGETVLLHAAASGVGTAAVQMASQVGANVIGLTRSEDKAARLRALASATVIVATAESFAHAIAQPVNLIIDFLGASSWAGNIELLRERGRLILVGTMSGAQVQVDLAQLLRKRLTIIGTVLRNRPLEEKRQLVRLFSQQMLPLFAAKKLIPIVDRVFPWTAVSEAHQYMESNANFGKIVLQIQ